MANANMHQARNNKNDEFYTKRNDIEEELKHYREHFRGKHIFMNADDPEESNFWFYFYNNFDFLGLKKITSTHYHETETTYRLDYDGKEIIKTLLEQNGDFRSPESIEILKEADIVVTNPPFSLYREYVAQLIEYNKNFLIIGNYNSITYKEIFPLIKENKMWVGVSPRSMSFVLPDGSEKSVNAAWFTNLEHNRRRQELRLGKNYSVDDYPEYDNYNAINVDRVLDIPIDYEGIIGVPITFLTKHNPEQFEIIGSDFQVNEGLLDITKEDWDGKVDRGYLDGKRLYSRILIKKVMK